MFREHAEFRTKKAEVGSGRPAGISCDMAEKMQALKRERENRELRQADESFRKASAYDAMAELDHRSK